MRKSGGAAIRMQLNSELLKFYIGDMQIVEKMPDLPVGQPFDERRIDFLNEVSQILLTDKEAKAYSDIVTFAFWIRKANMEKEKQKFDIEKRHRVGRGVVFHIAPSNVAVNYAYSFAVGFILGNANIVRLPTREFEQINIINRVVKKALNNEVYKIWKDYIIFLRYGKSKDINDYFSNICDMRIIWGGDATIHEIRQSALSTRAGEITFGDRYSICVIKAEDYMRVPDKDRLALDFYNDTYLTDQNACTSPRAVFWLGEKAEIAKAKQIFWEKLGNIVEKKYQFQPIQYVDKLLTCCMAAASMEDIHIVKMKDNRIVRLEADRISLLFHKYQGNSGVFYEYELKDIQELIPLCNMKMQTVALVGDEELLAPLFDAGVKGIDRVVSVGKTMNFDFIWDGYDLKERLVREIIRIR